MTTITYSRTNPLAVVVCKGRKVHIPMVSDTCFCGVKHNMWDQTSWYADRVGGNSENGYEPVCEGHDGNPPAPVAEPVAKHHHFTGTYADGITRHWGCFTADPQAHADSYLTGFLPFATVTFVECPEATMFCGC